MNKFVKTSTLAHLEKLKKEIRHTTRHPGDEDAIHDLRVAIRRFTQCLRIFAQFFGDARVRKIRHGLKQVMDRCGAVRNCDIALEVLKVTDVQSKKLHTELV